MAMIRRHWWVAVLVGIGGLIAALFLLGVIALPGHGPASKATDNSDDPRANKVVPVTVATVIKQPIQRRVQVVGSLYGEEEIPIGVEVDGTVKVIHYSIGDRVKPGDVLMELDDRDYKRAVEDAQGLLDIELKRLGLPEVPARTFDIMTLPSVKAAVAHENYTSLRLKRAQKVGNAASQEDLDLAEAEYQKATAQAAQAKFDANSTLAKIFNQETKLLQAKEQHAKCKLIAPAPTGKLAGRPLQQFKYAIADRMVSEGQPVRKAEAGSKPAFRLVIDDQLKLDALVPERYRGQIAPKQQVEIEIEAFPEETFKGIVTRVNETIDRASRTYHAEIRIDNADQRLAAGNFAKASIVTNRVDEAMTVPEVALVTYAGVIKVFVLDGDKVHEVPVKLGSRIAEHTKGGIHYWIEVRGSLKPGDKVVTSGMAQLVDGSSVRVR